MTTQYTPQDPPHSPPSTVVLYDSWCVNCGYNIVRLPTSGACPACGCSIHQSISSNLLADSSPEHLESLRKGTSYILNSILVSIVFAVAAGAIGGIVGYMNSNGAPTPPTPYQPAPLPLWLDLLLGLGGFIILAFALRGQWLLTSLDPTFAGRHAANGSRMWIRNLAVIIATLAVTQFIVQQITLHIGVSLAFGVLSLFIWAASISAQMSYVTWLAPRLQDAQVAARAKLLVWLAPLLCTVGMLLLFLGPLIAIIMYWNLLNSVRRDLKYLLERQAYDAYAANVPPQ